MDEAKGVAEEVCQDSEFFVALNLEREANNNSFLYTQHKHKKGISEAVFCSKKREKRIPF